ncbi:MAG: hypothetical protein QOF89_3216 [Acidobacteriota bacterium]|jgi:hypothetical protein|nr:hypothetical protein [Acidobacteriota bacterium]
MRGYYEVSDLDAVISYTPDDRDIVAQIAKALRGAGLHVWFDYWNLIPGMDLMRAQMEALEATRVVLTFVGSSKYSREQRAWVKYEASVAGARYLRSRDAITVIPILLSDARPSDLPAELSSLSYIALENSSHAEIDRLVALLCMRVGEVTGKRRLPRIFLCHAKEDDERVAVLFSMLREEGFDPWYDKERLEVGDRWEEEISAAIESTDFFAICLSQASVTKRGFVQREIRTAIREFQRRAFDLAFLLPIRFEECQVPDIHIDENTTLRSIQWADLFPGDTRSFKRFVKGVQKQWRRSKGAT